jgi:hypothetical protein
MTDDKLLKELQVVWENSEPHLQNLSIIIENQSIVEREGDEARRKVASDFLELIKANVSKVKPEFVKVSYAIGLFLNYSTLLNEKFEMLFYPFMQGRDDLGYWVEDEKRMYINTRDIKQFNEILKNKNYSRLFDIYESTIFHELIHRFDHMRYSKSHKPGDYDSYVNTYEEFNAFYQQYARSIDKIVNIMHTLDEFYSIYGDSPRIMIANFWNDMPDEMKAEIKSSKSWTNKWNKRVYQLYYEKLKLFQAKGKG